MDTERRLENKRMRVAKRMELSCLETGIRYLGATEDVSDSGIRALLNNSPKDGSNVMVKLFWDEEKNPVESFGRVAWSAPMPVGDGIEVGLMIGAEYDVYGKKKKIRRSVTRHQYPQRYKKNRQHVYPNNQFDYQSIEHNQTVAAIPIQACPKRTTDAHPVINLRTGENIEVSYFGQKTWARISQMNSITTQGEIHLTVRLKNQLLWKKDEPGHKPPTKKTSINTVVQAAAARGMMDIEDNTAEEAEQWIARPFHDAWQTTQRYVGPTAKNIVKICLWLLQSLWVTCQFLWKSVPKIGKTKTKNVFKTAHADNFIAIYKTTLQTIRNTSTKLKTRFANR